MKKELSLIEKKELVNLQNAIYTSKNPTRKRLHNERLCLVKKFIVYVQKNKTKLKVLEIGPGSGIYLPFLKSNLAQVFASDIEKTYLQNINIPNIKLIEDDIENTQFQENNFDIVLCSEVLEHLSSPENAIRNISKILKNGGFAIITTPQKYSLMEICCKIAFLPLVINIVRMIYCEPILKTGHISLRTQAEIKNQFSENSFKIIKQKKIGLYIPILAEISDGKLIKKIEGKLRKNHYLDIMLWTQCYIIQKDS